MSKKLLGRCFSILTPDPWFLPSGCDIFLADEVPIMLVYRKISMLPSDST